MDSLVSLLVIDDDDDIGDALLSFLSGEGYRVRVASSGKQGIEYASAEMPQIILLDWNMPQMGGGQVLKELAALPTLKDVPVILMSANIANIPEEIRKSRRHLHKPFNVNALVSLIGAVLRELK